MVSLRFALVFTVLVLAVSEETTETLDVFQPKFIDQKTGFCQEIRHKYNLLVTALSYSRVLDYFSGNATQYQTFLDAENNPKTFFDESLKRDLPQYEEPKVLKFKITNNSLLEDLRSEMAKAVGLIKKIKFIEFGGQLAAPVPTKLDISFNYYHFFSPSLVDYYESIKGEFPTYLRYPKAMSLEGLQVQVGKTPTGVHNQGNQLAGRKFHKFGSEFANTFNIHFALTDVSEETSPLVFWKNARSEVISSRYVYKLLRDNPELLAENHLSGFFSLLSWVETDLSFWRYVLFKAEADWDLAKEGTRDFVRATYLMPARYYLSTYCNAPNGSDLVQGIWFPIKAGQGVLFNPYQLHASDSAFAPASKVRNSIVIRACDKSDCKVAYKGYQPSDEKLYECFAILFGYKNADDFKQTIFGTLDNKVYGLYSVQLDHPEGITLGRLRDHYARAREYLSQDDLLVSPEAEKCFVEYLAIGKAAANAYEDL